MLVVGFLLVACGSGQPSIAVEATSLDLGNVVNGDIVSRDLTLSNDGNADLVIDSIITSCTCTQASVNPMTIPPAKVAPSTSSLTLASTGQTSPGL